MVEFMMNLMVVSFYALLIVIMLFIMYAILMAMYSDFKKRKGE